MARSPAEFIKYFKYVWRGTSVSSIIQRFFLKMISPIVKSDAAYIAIRYGMYRADKPLPPPPFEDPAYTCEIVTRYEDIKDLGDDDPDETMMAELKTYFDAGPKRVLVAVLLHEPGVEGCKFVGYAAYAADHFSYWDGRLGAPLPSDCMYISNIFSLPSQRGTRVHSFVNRAVNKYS